MPKLRIFFIPGLLAALLLIMSAGLARAEDSQKQARQDEPNEIITRLPNGLLVYIIKDSRFPLVCTRLYVRAGSANEEPAQAGISHVLEHMVFKGTSHRPKGQVARDVEALGGYLNAATSFDKTWYLTDMPAAHWRTGMDVVRDMAFQATLDEKELEAEKNVVISELQRGEDSPMRKLREELQTAALKNTPYGRPIIGYEDTIRAITADDLRAYVKRWYQPQNMMLLVAGDIKPAEVLTHAQKLFGQLKNTSDLPLLQPLPLENAAAGAPLVEVSKGAWNKVYLGLALPAPGLEDFRSSELDVLCYLLGGDGASRFYKKYKYEKQLVDSISINNMSLARAGLLTITAQLDPAKIEDFWRELTADLAKLDAGEFSLEAIARAKFNLEDSIDRAGETLEGLAAWQGVVQFDLGGKQGEDNLRFVQKNIGQPQLENAIRLWLNPGQARIRVLAPQDSTLPDFEKIMRENWPQAAPAANADKDNGKNRQNETIKLDNGSTLILLPDDSAPYVSINLIMAGGNAMLQPQQQGLADLAARMLTDGCADLNSPALERWLSERAASISARAGLQTFSIALAGPSRFNSDYFGLLRNILLKPRFEPGELMRETENMKSAIKQRNDQPLAFMFSKLTPFLFPGGQPYGYDSLGAEKSLDTFNTVTVRDFWAKQNAQPWSMAIAGKFDRNAAIEFAQRLPAPRSQKFMAANPQWGTDKTLNLQMRGRSQAHLALIFKTVPPTHPDAPALMLLQAVLSGQSGILFSKLRDEQGLGYTVTAFNRAMPQTGFMAFYIGSTPDKLHQARKGFGQIIDSLKKTPLSAEIVKAGSNRLLGDYQRDRQSLASRAGEAATDSILDYPPDFQKLLVERVQNLGPEDVRAAAVKYLENPYEVTLLP